MIIRFLLLLSFCSITTAQELKLQLSQKNCTPGEPVMLTATLRTQHVTSFEPSVPPLPKLHVVSTQKSPIVFANGIFTQSQQWLIQPTHTGVITIDNFQATVSRGEQSETLVAKPATLMVSQVEGIHREDTAEPLPISILTQSSQHLIFIILGGAALAFILYIATKKNHSNNIQSSTEVCPPTIDSVIKQLTSGTVPKADIHHLLEHTTLARHQREALEKAIYSDRSDAAEILTEFNKEDRS